jgi:hypothetical protein
VCGVLISTPIVLFYKGLTLVPLAYAGTGLRRRSSIKPKIFWNKLLGTATSATWNVTYRPWRAAMLVAAMPVAAKATCLNRPSAEIGGEADGTAGVKGKDKLAR